LDFELGIIMRLDVNREKIARLQARQKSTQSDLAALEQSIPHQAFNLK